MVGTARHSAGDAIADAAREPIEIVIDGKRVDVTDMIKKHPGGNILRFYKDQDATLAFNEFHSRSPSARKWLNSLPSRPTDESLSTLEKEFIEFRAQLTKEGMFDPSYAHIAYRFAELGVLHYLGLSLLFGHYWLPAAIVLGIAAGRCGWLMHEGGHYSLTTIPWLDRHLQMLLYCLGDGMSASYWRNQHNKHHAMPQKLEHDVDLNTLPLLAFHRSIAQKGSRWWLRWQAYLFLPVVTVLVALGWQFFLHPRHCVRTKRYVELGYFALRYALIGWFIVPRLGLQTTVAMYLLASLMGGMYIFGNFALSHTHKPIVEVDEQKDWVHFSADHTTNISTDSLLVTWWMGYLNFQIEHHLFPHMPEFRNPIVAPRVREFFAKHGIHYDERSYFSALADTLRNLDNVGRSTAHGAKDAQ